MLFPTTAAYVFAALAGGLGALAAPAHIPRAGVTAVSAQQLSSFTPFTQFAAAAYCDSDKIKDWKCGSACDALPGFQPTLTGGDGNGVQLFFVGFWPQENSVIISHQGTDPTQLLSVLTDLNFPLDPLDEALFPGIPAGVEAHSGFSDQQAQTAGLILPEVKRLLAEKNSKKVTVIGHSLGGALAELDAVFMTLNLPADVAVNAVTYGKPRVGNAEWAALVDQRVPNFVRINNDDDPVPIVPGRFLGFVHPKGEIHILKPGKAVACEGNDSEEDQCTIDDVPNLLLSNVLDHLGPYEGIHIGSIFC